jgi:hypothetical protein
MFDLETLSGLVERYAKDTVIVGPLRCLWNDAEYRIVFIAGQDDRVYTKLDLGHIEDDTVATRVRLKIIEALRGLFTDVVPYGDRLEAVRAVHTLWPCIETERAVADAEREAPLPEEPPKQIFGKHASVDDGTYRGTDPDDPLRYRSKLNARANGPQGVGSWRGYEDSFYN